MTHVKQSVNGSTILTDEIVEKAASAAYHTFCADTGSHGFDEAPQEWVAAARAALEAVLPDVVDAIGEATPEIKCLRSRLEAAAAIRSLLNKEGA